MATAEQTFLATLESEPWFAGVHAIMQTNGIADPLWISTLQVEDGQTLDPRQQTLERDGTYSIGLFQLNDRGVGAPMTIAQRQDPYTNATTAAQQMAKQIAADNDGKSDLATQLRSIEKAGWNGTLDEDATRQAALAQVVSATSGLPPNPLDALNPGSPYAPSQVVAPAAKAAANALGLPSTPQIQTWLTDALIASVLLAVLAGGFALLAAPSIAKAAPIAAAAA